MYPDHPDPRYHEGPRRQVYEQILAIMRALVDEFMSLEIDFQPVPVLLNPRSSAAAKLEGRLLSQHGRGSANVSRKLASGAEHVQA